MEETWVQWDTLREMQLDRKPTEEDHYNLFWCESNGSQVWRKYAVMQEFRDRVVFMKNFHISLVISLVTDLGQYLYLRHLPLFSVLIVRLHQFHKVNTTQCESRRSPDYLCCVLCSLWQVMLWSVALGGKMTVVKLLLSVLLLHSFCKGNTSSHTEWPYMCTWSWLEFIRLFSVSSQGPFLCLPTATTVCASLIEHSLIKATILVSKALLKCVSVRSAEKDTKWGSINANCLWGTDRWHRRSDTVEAAGKVIKWMPQPLSVKHKLIKAVFNLWLEWTPDPSCFSGFMLYVFSVHLETVTGWCMFCWLQQPRFCNSLLRLIQ